MAARQAVVLSSAARAATNVSDAQQAPPSSRGAIFTVDVTAVPGVDTVQLTIQSYDQASGKWTDYATFATTAATGTFLKVLDPAAVAAPGGATVEAKIGVLPATYRARVVHSAGTSFTYSVGVQYL